MSSTQQKKEQAKLLIKKIREENRKEIAKIKYELSIELQQGDSDKTQKIVEKEKKRQERDARRIEYENAPKRYSVSEEIGNSITHGIGACLSVAALVILVVRAVSYAPSQMKVAFVTGYAIFGASLILLYVMSTLYHALTPYGAKKVFSVFDHSSIYVLIAGSYTPFCLTVLQGPIGWTLFGIIWALAVLGIVFYAVFGNRIRYLSVITYVLMGWLIIFAIKPIKEILSTESLFFLISGGVTYTIGVVFYSLKKIRFAHCVWHLFVLAGSILHFFSLYFLLN